ncbi:alpha-hydroxy-acid oxidizing protein [Rhodosalinus halophilus]|uniref:Alpha-hydroxy-acid oxidizing protein n=1 Tax=Rhodosalinus halophilus TaxID=2259333 RepID=A0A365UBU6_9RHOB|nr:alpha-hydroxy acid oxidase [Rhodosalinus halophilus]RBI86701.1 alpha-hydroxy-acid oxidizing protein [Rhodosalinus halophilus]
MDLDARLPAIADLRARARARVPRFVWEYLDSATGAESVPRRNRRALDAVRFYPSVLHGEVTPDLSAELFGHRHPLPFGAAPLGMSGLIWPGAERLIAQATAAEGLPCGLSTVATRPPEEIGPLAAPHGWFQLYPPRDEGIRADMLKRARDSGFSVLVLTVDVPVPSRRERQTRSGLTIPPKLTPRLMAQMAVRPRWSLATLRAGLPRLRTLDPYTEGPQRGLPSTGHVGYMLRTSPDLAYLRWLRAHWEGPLVVKGVLRPEDAALCEAEGVDAVWVSNHAGRQFDAAPATAEVLPAIRAAVRLPLVFDGGIEGGLDILRAIALGADYVMLGRAWHYAVAALGEAGPPHLIDMLRKDLIANMGQLGATQLAEVAARRV